MNGDLEQWSCYHSQTERDKRQELSQEHGGERCGRGACLEGLDLWVRKPDTGDLRGRNQRNKQPNLLASIQSRAWTVSRKISKPFFLVRGNLGSPPISFASFSLKTFFCHLPCFSNHHLHLDKQYLSILIPGVTQHE